MGVNEMRDAIIKVYGSESWKNKVSKMSDAQVTAVYLKFKSSGKLDAPAVVVKPNSKYIRKDIDTTKFNKKTEESPRRIVKRNTGYTTFDEALFGDEYYY
jgi:hypothetical protein